MGRLAIGLAGAAIGSIFGQPGLGFGLGSMLGSVLFPGQTPTTYGPRLADLTVTSSAFGQPITKAWGTIRLNGNIIWGRIREKKTVTRQGGKGGPTAKAVNYTYSGDFAVSFCEGPADAVLQIFANGKMIFDRTSNEPDLKVKDLEFRWYPGTEDQLPDPHIQAAVGDDRTPAYRGQVVIVFEDLPLEQFGNSLPNITAVIAMKASPRDDFDVVEVSEQYGYLHNGYVPDFDRERIFVMPGAFFTTEAIVCLNTRTRQEVWRRSAAQLPANLAGMLGVDGGGNLLLVTSRTPNYEVVVLNGDSGAELGRVPFVMNSAPGAPITRFPTSSVSLGDVESGGENHLVHIGGIGLVMIDQTPAGIFLVGQWWIPAGEMVLGMIAGDQCVWLLAGVGTAASVTSLKLYRWEPGGAPSLRRSLAFTRLVPDIGTGVWTYNDVTPLYYDGSTDCLLLAIRRAGGGSAGGTAGMVAVKYDPDNDDVLWRTELPSDPDPISLPDCRPGSPSIFFQPSRGTVRVSDGVYTEWEHIPSAFFPGRGPRAQAWDGFNESLISAAIKGTETGAESGVGFIYFNRLTGGTASPADVAADLAERVGLDRTRDLAVTDLMSMTLPGYALTRQISAREALQPLADIFLFDGVESDGRLKFFARGRQPVRALTQCDLLREDGQLAFRETRTQEVELPLRVTITHIDPARDYEEGQQTAKRLRHPLATTASQQPLEIQIAAVLDATFVKRQAEQILYSDWIGRANLELKTSWTHLDLDPADVVTVTMDDGTVHRVRLASADIGADLTVEAKGSAEEDAQYVSTVEGDSGDYPLPTVPVSGPARLFLLDAVLLRDGDDTGGSVTGRYFAIGGYGQPGWRLGLLYEGPTPTEMDPVDSIGAEAIWGTAMTALPAPHSPWVIDDANTLDVKLATGLDIGLDSVTREELLDGANAAGLIRRDGRVEILQFERAEQLAADTYRLSGLLRGRRGSEPFCAGHQVGDAFLLLSPATLGRFTTSIGEIGRRRFFKGIGIDGDLQRAELDSSAPLGTDLMPLAPVHLRATIAGADIQLAWVRRTRIGGGLRDGIGEVPLGEAAEAYQVDILSAGGAVLRTLAAAAPTVTYPADQIAADFGGMPAELSIAVHQVSAAVGRGFAATATLELA